MSFTEHISGLIITFNEEKNIQEVLDCFDFCEEIIVVDSFSSDNTVKIASRNPKVKIIQHRFEDFTKQRNIALDAAKIKIINASNPKISFVLNFFFFLI